MNEAPVKYGIDQLLPPIMLAAEVGNVIDKMGHTKGPGRYAHLISLLDEATAMAGVDYKLAKKQFLDVDEAEMVEIKAKIKVKFDLIDDDLEGIIELGFDAIEDFGSGITKCVEMAKSIKAKKAQE